MRECRNERYKFALPIFLMTASSKPEKNLEPSFIMDENPGALGTCNAIFDVEFLNDKSMKIS